ETAVRLQKSSNAALDVMRPNMLFSGLEAFAYNHNRRNFDLKFFEFGKTYASEKVDNFIETEHLSLFVSGNILEENHFQKPQAADIFYLKGVVKNIFSLLGINRYSEENLQSESCAHGLRYTSGKNVLVEMGSVSPKTLKSFDIEKQVFFADFHWDNLLKQMKPNAVKFKEIPRFPWVRRDLALLIDKAVTFAEIEKIAHREVKQVLKSVNLFDIYEDKKLGDNKKSYAVSFVFEDAQKTLKDEQVDAW